MSTCLQAWDDKGNVLVPLDRYSAPLIPIGVDLPDKKSVDKQMVALNVTPIRQCPRVDTVTEWCRQRGWAATYTVKLKRLVSTTLPDAESGYSAAVVLCCGCGPLDPGSACYVCVERLQSTDRLLEHVLEGAGQQPGEEPKESKHLRLRCLMPFTVANSMDVFLTIFHRVYKLTAAKKNTKQLEMRLFKGRWAHDGAGFFFNIISGRAKHVLKMQAAVTKAASAPSGGSGAGGEPSAAASAPGGGSGAGGEPSASTNSTSSRGSSDKDEATDKSDFVAGELEAALEGVWDEDAMVPDEVLGSSAVQQIADELMSEAAMQEADDQEHQETTRAEHAELDEAAVRQHEISMVKAAVRAESIPALSGDDGDLGVSDEDIAIDAALCRIHGLSGTSSSSAGQTTTSATLPPLFSTWHAAACRGVTLLNARAEACRRVAVRAYSGADRLYVRDCDHKVLGEGGYLSLLSIPGHNAEHHDSIAFISWSGPQHGRAVTLDDNRRVKMFVPVGEMRAPKDLSGAVVIHPDCARVRALKVRGKQGKDRPSMPQDILDLQRMWLAAQAVDDQGDNYGDAAVPAVPAHMPCVHCESLGAAAVHTCALCLLGWHDECMDKFYNAYQDTLANMEHPAVDVPEDFVGEDFSSRSPMP